MFFLPITKLKMMNENKPKVMTRKEIPHFKSALDFWLYVKLKS
jgi:hypothetical protein